MQIKPYKHHLFAISLMATTITIMSIVNTAYSTVVTEQLEPNTHIEAKNHPTIIPNRTVRGRLTNGTPKSYSLTVPQRALAVIDLKSDKFDSLLRLQGTNIDIEENEGGNYNDARIATILIPGQYIVTADRYKYDDGSGSFTLETILVDLMPTDSNSISSGFAIKKQWHPSIDGNELITLNITKAGNYRISLFTDDSAILNIHGQIPNTPTIDAHGDNFRQINGIDLQLPLQLNPGSYIVFATPWDGRSESEYIIMVTKE